MTKTFLDFLDQLDAEYASVVVNVPPVRQAQAWIDNCLDFIFPVRSERQLPARGVYPSLHHQLIELLQKVLPAGQKHQAEDIAEEFFHQLPEVHRKLQADSKAFYLFDPAAESLEEVMTTYCSFFAIAIRIIYMEHQIKGKDSMEHEIKGIKTPWRFNNLCFIYH